MEIILCVFLGLWISAAGVCAYFWIKKEMAPFMNDKDTTEEEPK